MTAFNQVHNHSVLVLLFQPLCELHSISSWRLKDRIDIEVQTVLNFWSGVVCLQGHFRAVLPRRYR